MPLPRFNFSSAFQVLILSALQQTNEQYLYPAFGVFFPHLAQPGRGFLRAWILQPLEQYTNAARGHARPHTRHLRRGFSGFFTRYFGP